jgi:type I restriction enzyme S subunit
MSSELRSIWKSAGGKIPDEWAVVTLESLLLDNKSISVGVMYPGEHTPGGVPLIKVGDIKDGSIPVRPEYCISPETNHEYRRSQLSGEELLITLVGNPGECVVVTPEMTGWNPARAIASVRLKDSELRTYIKAVLESSVGKHLVDVVLNTTVQKTLNLKDIRRLPIPMPDKGVIKGISSISEALTNRISLLRETNKTLQAIAQAIFKSWFIDFDPVRAKMEGRAPSGMDEETAELFPDELVEYELGLIPRGWCLGSISDVAHNSGLKVKTEAMHEALNYVGLEHIPRRCISLNSWGIADGLESTKSSFSHSDILFGKLRPYFHKVVIAPIDGICSTDILVLKPKNLNYYGFVVMHLFSDAVIAYADKLSNGAKMPRISWKDIGAYKVAMPSEEIALKFNEISQPIFKKIMLNVLTSQRLATIRDTLLPRLISGKLRVSVDHFEIAT